jgi:hypothetical protein
MDSDAFDRLVRGFSESTSRRRALGGLLVVRVHPHGVEG